MNEIADYDQSLNKLGKLLLLFKCGNAKANTEIEKIRAIVKNVLVDDAFGMCYMGDSNVLFGDLQLHRLQLGCLIFSKCSSDIDVKTVSEDFDVVKKAYSDYPCIFKHVIDVTEVTDKKDGSSTNPVTEECVCISKDFEATFTLCLKTLITDVVDLCSTLLKNKKDIPADDIHSIENCFKPFLAEEKLDLKKQRKFIVGRWFKHLGDLSFSSGLMLEAEQYFSRALDLLRGANDPWLAACKESVVAVSLMNALKVRSLPETENIINSISVKQWTIWFNTYEDATFIYGSFSSCYSLYLESLLRFAQLQILGGHRTQAARTINLFTSFDVSSVPSIGKGSRELELDKAKRYRVAAKIFESLSWHRKAAFNYRMAAMQCITDVSQSCEWINCYKLLMKATRGYGLANFSDEHRSVQLPLGFVQLQSRLLMDLYSSALAFKNYPLALRHVCQALGIGGQTFFAYQLSQVFNDMRKMASYSETLNSPLVIDTDVVLHPVRSSPYPHLISVNFHSETTNRSSSIIRPSTLQSPPKFAFIYSPFARTESSNYDKPLSVCAGEEIKVVLDFENQFVLPLKIDSICLLGSHTNIGSFECLTSGKQILFPSEPKSIILTCVGKAAGKAIITGCTVKISGVTRKILFADVLSTSNRLHPSRTCFEVEILPIELPFLSVQPPGDGDYDVNTFLGEVTETAILLENSNEHVKAAIVDLTLRGVPPAVDKALQVSFKADNVINIRLDGTSLPPRFSSAFEVSAKFVYTSLNQQTDNSSQHYFRSLNFTFHVLISAVVYGTVVAIERRSRNNLMFDIKFEHISNEYRENPLEVEVINKLEQPAENKQKTILNPGGTRHIQCLIDNQSLAPLLPDLINLAEEAHSIQFFNLSDVVKFDWRLLSTTKSSNKSTCQEILRFGQSALVCMGELISQLKIPPFEISINWWDTRLGESTSKLYEYGEAVTLKLADHATFLITARAVDEINSAVIRLNMDSKERNLLSQTPYFISGLTRTTSRNLDIDEISAIRFCVIPSATGRHRISYQVETSEGTWLCPTIIVNCSE